jgi:hypothetical protein
MSVAGGPNLIKNGLVLELDAGNIKSYPTTGTTWYDKSGNAYNGTLINGPTFNTGSLGSIVFDGTNDGVSFSNLGNFGTNPVSYEWVVKSTPNGNFQNLFTNGSDALAHIYIINNGNIRYYSEGAYDTSGLSINTNIFKFITITKSGTSALIYINGIQQATLTISETTGNFNTPYVGINGSQYPLNGSIASFKLYNKTLSASEVLQNYNATKGRFGL